jgi:hypothetical protein
MKSSHRVTTRYQISFVMVAAVLLLVGCGTAQHSVKVDDAFTPQAGTLVEVGPVTNQTGHTFEVNVDQLLTDALTQELRSQKLLWTGSDSRRLVLLSTIVEYEEGNAFKRWMLPGWGGTALTVRGDLKDGDRIVGSVDARRTVSAGGGYTIGAWKSIFGDLAKDIVADLRAKLAK